MEKEFVPYELALELKQLGFDIPSVSGYSYSDSDNLLTQAILYQQAFRWFREKYALCIVIKPIDDKNLELGYNLLKNGLMMGSHLTYEEAESACLQKLIEIVKTK